jgi:hypothetical protein
MKLNLSDDTTYSFLNANGRYRPWQNQRILVGKTEGSSPVRAVWNRWRVSAIGMRTRYSVIWMLGLDIIAVFIEIFLHCTCFECSFASRTCAEREQCAVSSETATKLHDLQFRYVQFRCTLQTFCTHHGHPWESVLLLVNCCLIDATAQKHIRFRLLRWLMFLPLNGATSHEVLSTQLWLVNHLRS